MESSLLKHTPALEQAFTSQRLGVLSVLAQKRTPSHEPARLRSAHTARSSNIKYTLLGRRTLMPTQALTESAQLPLESTAPYFEVRHLVAWSDHSPSAQQHPKCQGRRIKGLLRADIELHANIWLGIKTFAAFREVSLAELLRAQSSTLILLCSYQSLWQERQLAWMNSRMFPRSSSYSCTPAFPSIIKCQIACRILFMLTRLSER